MTATCLLCNNEHESGLRVCPHCGALHGLRTTTKDLNEQRVILKRLADEHASHSSTTSAELVLEEVYRQLNTLYETVELHGHYRKILTDADIECLFAELRAQRGREREQ